MIESSLGPDPARMPPFCIIFLDFPLICKGYGNWHVSFDGLCVRVSVFVTLVLHSIVWQDIFTGLVACRSSLWLTHDLREERSMLHWASTSICWWQDPWTWLCRRDPDSGDFLSLFMGEAERYPVRFGQPESFHLGRTSKISRIRISSTKPSPRVLPPTNRQSQVQKRFSFPYCGQDVASEITFSGFLGEGVIDVLQWVLDLLSFVDDSWPRPGILCSRILQWAYIVVRMTKIALINMIHLFSAGPWWHIATYYPDRNGTWPGQVSELSIYFSEYVGFLAYVPYDWISAGERSTEEHKPWKSPVPSSMMVKTTHLQFLSGRTRPFVEAWRLILCRITLRYRSVSPMSSEFLLILLWNIEFRRALYSDPVGHMDLSFETRRRRILILLSRTIVSIDLIRYRILSSGDGPLSMSIACGLLSRLHSLPFVEPFEMSSSSIGQLHGTKTFLGCVVLPFQVAGVYMDKMILLLLHMRGRLSMTRSSCSLPPLGSISGYIARTSGSKVVGTCFFCGVIGLHLIIRWAALDPEPGTHNLGPRTWDPEPVNQNLEAGTLNREVSAFLFG
ncbi:hypothetical protein F2Q68_00015903 [Brassica cretica]|uniref:Uncharacterized protein n=1 Tax=Brassica cretica TaxID=69181 RepID=A0A8S9HH75_BRACR|nr:hypothetical protein F2Q68_00015903 [Brassica cretica]